MNFSKVGKVLGWGRTEVIKGRVGLNEIIKGSVFGRVEKKRVDLNRVECQHYPGWFLGE
jgi:hypothetical protein